MFLTPDAEPFWGGTYFPKTARYGQPALRRRAAQRGALCSTPSPTKYGRTRTLCARRSRARHAGAGTELLARLPRRFRRTACRHYRSDAWRHSRRAEFPNPSILELLWRASLRTGNTQIGALVMLTLDRMSEGGIYDHLGGGYSRYSTDDAGSCRISRKCSTTMRRYLICLPRLMPKPAASSSVSGHCETVAWLEREMTDARRRVLREPRRRQRRASKANFMSGTPMS